MDWLQNRCPMIVLVIISTHYPLLKALRAKVCFRTVHSEHVPLPRPQWECPNPIDDPRSLSEFKFPSDEARCDIDVQRMVTSYGRTPFADKPDILCVRK